MQAVVKTPLIEIRIKGEIPQNIISLLRQEYGNQLQIKGTDSQLANPFDSDWYKKISKEITPQDNLKLYRKLHAMSQADLGKKLGGIPRQNISNMENGIRAISVSTARKLAKLFSVSVDKFIKP